MEKQIYEIVHRVYGDICGDSYYGKSARVTIIAYVQDDKDKIERVVDELNKKNHSYYAKSEPEDDLDMDWMDEDYIYVREHNITLTDINDLGSIRF